MTEPFRPRIFKSGDPLAVRLPKVMGASEGAEMTVREERGKFTIEPVQRPSAHIDLTGIAGSIPGLRLLKSNERLFEERELDWNAKRPELG